MSPYVPTDYWESLLGTEFSERAVAYPNLPVSLNRAMYRSMVAAVDGAARRLPATPRSVLDIGSGTGVWIDFWRRRGVVDIVGVDLTEAAVTGLRRRFADVEFVRADVTDLDPGRRFDLVSAISVLLHITDDGSFREALRRLGAALAPGGAMIVVDAVIVRRWWGEPFGSDSNSRARSLQEWETALAAAGLRIADLRPATCLLSNVIDTRRRRAFGVLWFYWGLLGRLTHGSERRGALAGWLLGGVDRLLCRIVRPGPSAKVMVIVPTG